MLPYAEFFHLGALAIAISGSFPGVWVPVFVVGQLRGHGGDGGGEFLDICLHRRQLVLCLYVGGCVSC